MKSRFKIFSLIGLLAAFVIGCAGCSSNPYYGAPYNKNFVPKEVRAER